MYDSNTATQNDGSSRNNTKKENIDQELEPKKRPSKERRGWQGEEKKIENPEQVLDPKKQSKDSRGWIEIGLLWLVLSALPASVLSARAFLWL